MYAKLKHCEWTLGWKLIITIEHKEYAASNIDKNSVDIDSQLLK